MKWPDRWQVATVTLIASILGVGGLALWLAMGAANPPTAPHLWWQDQQLAWAIGTDPQPLSTERQYYVAPRQLPAADFSVETVGTLTASTPTLAAWGYWIEISPEQWLLVGINGFQYVTARLCPPYALQPLATCPPAEEAEQSIATVWKYFHHIAPINDENRLQLHYLPADSPQKLEVRFDSEHMWALAFSPPVGDLQWGLWAEASEDIEAFLQWTSVRIWVNIALQ